MIKIKKMIVGEMEANCYLLQSKNEICIIDPGGDVDYIVGNIKERGGQLKYIICTHYHDDHTDGALELQNQLGGRILIHGEDSAYIDFEVNKHLEEGDILYIGNDKLEVLHTPGHSPGSICLLSGKYIFTGDTLFLNGCGRFDLLGGDEKELEDSLLRLSKIVVSGMEVLPGHGGAFLYGD